MSSDSITDWIKGRDRLTVSQDGSADFSTIGAAVAKLKEGKYVEIMDAGPYRERLSFSPHPDTALVSQCSTVVDLSEWIQSNSRNDPEGHSIIPYGRFHLHGLSFTYERKRQGGMLNSRADGLVISNCIFTGQGGTEFELHQPRVVLRTLSAGDSHTPDSLLIGNVFNVPIHVWVDGNGPGSTVLRNNLFLGHNMYYAVIPRATELANRLSDDSVPNWTFQFNENVFFDLLGGKARGILVAKDCAQAFEVQLTDDTFVGQRYGLLLGVADAKPLRSVRISGNILATRGRAIEWPTVGEMEGWIVNGNVLPEPFADSDQQNTVGQPKFHSVDLEAPDFLRPTSEFPKNEDGTFIGALQPLDPLTTDDWFSQLLKRWRKAGAEVLNVEPGSPWENGYVESFNSRLRDEFLSLEEFENLPAARSLTSSFRRDYNERRPHSSLGYMTPSDFATQWPASAQSAALPSL